MDKKLGSPKNNNDDSVILITTMGIGTLKNVQRRSEIKRATEINCSHDTISKVIVWLDCNKEELDKIDNLQFLKHPKISIEYVKARPTFQDFFRYANSNYPNQVVAINNADIAFFSDSGIEHALHVRQNEMWFLNRYYFNRDEQRWLLYGHLMVCEPSPSPMEESSLDTYPQGVHPRDYQPSDSKTLALKEKLIDFETIQGFGSADTFIFRTPIPTLYNTTKVGSRSCDTRLMLAAHLSGLDVLYPCLSIIARHFHLDDSRNYPKLSWYGEYLNRWYVSRYFRTIANDIVFCIISNPSYIRGRKRYDFPVFSMYAIRDFLIKTPIKFLIRQIKTSTIYRKFRRQINSIHK